VSRENAPLWRSQYRRGRIPCGCRLLIGLCQVGG
jgi:hypothetical protein